MPKRIVALLLALGLAGSAAAPSWAQSQTSLLHDALHLSAPQEDAWRTYQRAVAGDPQDEARARQTQMMLPTL